MITTATADELRRALDAVNVKYKGNVTFNRSPEPVGHRTRFTLKVADSKGPGARRGQTGRRMISACWHAHGDLFDALFDINPSATVHAGEQTITAAYGNWQDRNIGSMMFPLYFSEACDC